MKFEIEENELEKMEKWLQGHILDCSYWQPQNVLRNANTGPVSYVLTPTGTGLKVEAQCRCGQKTDITDYERRAV